MARLSSSLTAKAASYIANKKAGEFIPAGSLVALTAGGLAVQAAKTPFVRRRVVGVAVSTAFINQQVTFARTPSVLALGDTIEAGTVLYLSSEPGEYDTAESGDENVVVGVVDAGDKLRLKISDSAWGDAVDDEVALTPIVASGPEQLGAIAWWDARDSANISHTSNAVDSWTDRIGSRVVTASGAERPTWDGSGSISFDGGDKLQAAAVDSTLSAMHFHGSVFIRFSVNSTGRYVLLDTRDYVDNDTGTAVVRENAGNWDEEMRVFIRQDVGNVYDPFDIDEKIQSSDGVVNFAYTVDSTNDEGTQYIMGQAGVTDAFSQASGTDTSPGHPFTIGGQADGPGLNHNGTIEQIAIFDKVLTSAEVDELNTWANNL